MRPKINILDKIYRPKEDARRRTIRHNIAYLGTERFNMRDCADIRDLIIEADGLKGLPKEKRKEKLAHHEHELRILLAPEGSLMGRIGVVERYLDDISSRETFPDHTPALEEKR